MNQDEIVEIVVRILRQELDAPESTIVEAIQRLLFAEHGIDARRTDISNACRILFVPLDPVGADVVQPEPIGEQLSAATAEEVVVKTTLSAEAEVNSESMVLAAQDVATFDTSADTIAVPKGQWLELQYLLDNPARLVAGRRPEAIRLPNGSQAQVKSWRHLERVVLEWAGNTMPCPQIPLRPNTSGSTYFFLNDAPSHQITPMARPSEFLWGDRTLFAEMNQSGKNLLLSLARTMEAIGHTTADVSIVVAEDRSETDGTSDAPHNLGMEIAGILRQLSVPASYERITEEYNRGKDEKLLAPQRVRARLIDYPDLFAHLGDGIYALKEWGVNGQDTRRSEGEAISTVLLSLLEARDEPMEFADLCAGVLARRECKEASVRACLANDDRFSSFGRGRYGLKRWGT